MEILYRGPQLIPLKVVLFFLFAGIGALVPFLNIHLKDLGMTTLQTGFISLIAGFFSILGPLFGGVLTEKHGKYKPVLIIFILLSIGAYTGLLFVPKVIRTPPRTPELELTCSDSKLNILLEKCPSWKTCYTTKQNLAADFEAYSCRYICNGNVTFFKTTQLCFEGSNRDTRLCMLFNAANLNDTIRLTSTDLYKSSVGTKISQIPDDTEMCIYPLQNATLFESYFTDVRCTHQKPECDFICHLKEKKVFDPEGVHNSLFSRFHPCLQIFGNPYITFYIYLPLRSFADMCLMTVISLIDSVLILSVADAKGGYGTTRVWSALGLAVLGPVSGSLIDYYSEVEDLQNYSPAFIIFDGCLLIAAVLCLALPISSNVMAENMKSSCKSCLKLCQSAEGLILYLLVLILGSFWGFSDIYFYWTAYGIGASKLQIGLYMTAAFLCSAPFLAYSGGILRGFGKANLLVYAFLFYCIRFVALPFVENPWFLIPFQAMEVFTISLMWIGAVAYAQSIAFPGLKVTTQGALIALHFCAGRGIGGYLGVTLITSFGKKLAFCGVGVLSAVIGLLYWLAHVCCFRSKYKHPKQEPSPPGIALTGAYYPIHDQNSNNPVGNNRQSNGFTKQQDERLVDGMDEDFD